MICSRLRDRTAAISLFDVAQVSKNRTHCPITDNSTIEMISEIIPGEEFALLRVAQDYGKASAGDIQLDKAFRINIPN